MAIGIGSRVTCKEPFAEFYPGEWVVHSQNPDTGSWRIADDIDFHESNLNEVIE
jgi:hypothetical protein